MTASSSSPRKWVLPLAALLALAAAVVGFSAARDPAPPPTTPDPSARPPETEDTDSKPATHRVTSDDPDETNPATAPPPRTIDFAAAAADAKHLAIRNLFHELAVPHDVLKYNQFKPGQANASVNIVPITDYIGDKPDTLDPSFEATPFSRTSWATEANININRNFVEYIRPYEKLAEKAVDELFQAHYEKHPAAADYLSLYDQDVAAGQALTTVLLHLQSDRKTGVRHGDAWQVVEDSLKQKLLGVLLDELDAVVAAAKHEIDDQVRAAKWDEAFGLTKDLARSYAATQIEDRIGAAATALVTQAANDYVAQSLAGPKGKDAKQKALGRLRQLDDLFPDGKGIQPTAALPEAAQKLVEASMKDDAALSDVRLLATLRNVTTMWPSWPAAVRAARLQTAPEPLTLRVGVRQLPARERLSPCLALTDSDERAVELVFESLVKLAPDGAGGDRWEPGLALGRPTLIPRGRQFQLPPGARWSDGQRMTARDVADTVNLIKLGRVSGRSAVWGAALDRIDNIADPYQVNLTLPQGWLDPLALMNFKVLPSATDPSAPAHGSGPYLYDEHIQDDGRVGFTANPYYGARPGKSGRPRIEKIDFVAYRFKDDAEKKDAPNDHADELADELRSGRLDLLLDLTAVEATALEKKASDLNIKVTGRAAPNRRIYFLAVNNRKTFLDNPGFRLALAYAINRDKLLDDDFRAIPGQNLHTPLNGPYPVDSWAANPKLAQKRGDKTTFDPFDLTRAKTELSKSGARNATFDLLYPTGDPQAEKAMKELADQVKAIGVTLTPKPLPPDKLRDAVENTHNYYLAYYHYDFPDDVYWLGPLLDSTGGQGESGDNYLGYKAGLVQMIRDLSRRRDFPEVKRWAYEVQSTFLNQEMPFIPLWQLDPQAAVRADVEAPPFDPLLVFTDVDRWAKPTPK